jgi:predicted ribosomally synthesized peptide with SipW-like signal peptide
MSRHAAPRHTASRHAVRGHAVPRHAADRRDGWVRGTLSSVRVRAVLGFAVVLALATPGTYAQWTDEVQVNGTTITSGTIDLRVNGQDQVSGYTALDLAPMVPGNSTAAVLTIRNNGTAPLKYTAATSSTNADGKSLAAALVVKATGDTTATGTTPATTCAGAALPGSAASLDGPLLSTARLLAPDATEKVCVEVMLPENAELALQGATTTIGITFTGTSDVS